MFAHALALVALLAGPQETKPKYGFVHSPRKNLARELGEDALERFDRAVLWILNRQKPDGSWPGPEADALTNQSLALLVLMGGGTDVAEDRRKKAVSLGFDWLEAKVDAEGSVSLAPDRPILVIQQALAAWALLEGNFIEKRPGDAGQRAVKWLAGKSLTTGAFASSTQETEPDARASSFATLVLALAVDAKVLETKDVTPSHDWLRTRALEAIDTSEAAEGARTLASAAVLSGMILRRARGADKEPFWKLGKWVGEHAGPGSPEELALGTHAGVQLGKPFYQAWNAVQKGLNDRFETTGKEKGSAKPGADPSQRTATTLWLALTLQAGVRFPEFLSLR